MNTNEVPASSFAEASADTQEKDRAMIPTTNALAVTENTVNSPAPLRRRKAAGKRMAQSKRGPRTPEGKAVSRMNAVKHGILSSAIVVRGLRIQEHEEEFKALREQCWECLAPVGRMEEILVDKIVIAQWRSRRVLLAETGEIALSVDGGRWQRSKKDPISLVTLMDPTRDASETMTKSVQGLEYLRLTLEKVRENMEMDGELTEKTLDWVRERFMNQPNMMTRTLARYRERLMTNLSAVDEASETKTDSDGLSAEELRENHQRAVLSYIDLELETYAELGQQREEREDKEETAQQAANVLPEPEILEKIMRYEGALERQMYRALNQLERLQRRRAGENVPPPVTMEVVRR